MYSATEFLKHYEDLNPLPTNISFYDSWADDAKELWDLQVGEAYDNLDAVLSFRRQVLEEIPFDSRATSLTQNTPKDIIAADDNWKWLITAKQVEQRTSEWYKETKNIITASEISAIWKTPRARAALVMSKVGEAVEISVKRNSAFPRAKTGPMDWGVRYEPVVKQILETTLCAKIQELGRIRHRTVPRVAASPDGLIVEAEDPKLIGTLVEIKCPPTRVINDKIPFDYWCQMQLQMEVCGRPSCEFVEVKFKELDEDAKPSQELHGWIILEGNQESMDLRYIYSDKPTGEEGWVEIERYQWEVAQLRRVTLARDPVWFQASQGDLEAFWKDVEAAREGKWSPPPPLRQKKAAPEPSGCAIVASDSDKDVAPAAPAPSDDVSLLTISIPVPKHGNA
jgi:putative phage-type endonuclease